ncbi:MAG TPA: hypothetical protein ACQGQJ_02365 [Xylella fastidiosa subsp. multiplex]|uniref:hypothetical protein n=1 Tax=Xylella fastidiosa TaxID=2371 RepID=UPI001375C969|nr:hypothetical protein [Xylella fastidiosa]MCP8324592.1 hypothetical protein [Xylella fastidiosa subsp. multiplex]MDD0928597.1 hypothetical protein [Xylella fastidiosa subsp. multiplex]MDD0935012.1 hypothetical protein [Xylella fastidiosa subsp. multiplex]
MERGSVCVVVELRPRECVVRSGAWVGVQAGISCRCLMCSDPGWRDRLMLESWSLFLALLSCKWRRRVGRGWDVN